MTKRLAPTFKAMLATVPDDWAPAPPRAGAADVKAIDALTGRGLIETRWTDPSRGRSAPLDWRRTEAGRAVLGVLYQPAPDLNITPQEQRIAAVCHQVVANLTAAGYVSDAQLVAVPLDNLKLAVWVAVRDSVVIRDGLIRDLAAGKAGAKRRARELLA